MLRELHISNLAIIEKVDIEFAAGLNVFTGQTGAGKSLILGALELLLGLRGGGEDSAMFLRPGAEEARVSGLFEVANPPTAQRLARILDLTLAQGEPILITRRLGSSGRSSVSVNGSPVTAGMLREAGQFLVDIHGQHDQQFLLKQANQLLILDEFASATAARRQFAETLARLRDSQRRLRELRESEEKRAEQLDLYHFQIDEIDAARMQPGEYEAAKAQYALLKNVARLKSQSSQVLQGLADGDDAALDRLGTLGHSLQELVRLDPSLAGVAGQLDQAGDILQDVAKALTRYQDRLEADPGQLQELEDRLDVLNRLIHKYARSANPSADPVEAVLAHRRQIGQKVEALEGDSQALGGLDQEIAALQRQLAEAGGRLTRLRRQAAGKLKTLIERQFRDLEMNEASFDAEIVTLPAEDPRVDSSGLDELDFLVRTNPGQERLPLRKIASGGEISRIMLAVKTILADKDQVSVLVFDEIDANIGDRLGATIGQKMRALAHGTVPGAKPAGAGGGAGAAGPSRGHQVICITHLSQIAACADHHLHISKDIVGPDEARQTVARVRVLDADGRVRELAEMMAGKTPSEAVLTHARDLLAQAQRRGKPQAK
jgi:DNA repair protein RecN (Recombination protein N)